MKKDLLEQMRTVHFALMITAVALIAAGFGSTPQPLQNAKADAERIKYLGDSHLDLDRSLAAIADQAFSVETVRDIPDSNRLTVDNRDVYLLPFRPLWL